MKAKGLTLIELAVVVAVLAVILTLAVPSMSDLIFRRRIEGIASELVSDIQLLRAQALLKPGGYDVKELVAAIQVGNGLGADACYTLYWQWDGSTCDCSKPPGQACQSATPWAEIKTVHLPKTSGLKLSTNEPSATGGFEPGLHWFDPAGFRVTVAGNRAGSLSVLVDKLGRVSICSPDGSFKNYVKCQ